MSDEEFKPQRNEKGQFLPGHPGSKKRGAKRHITQRMLNKFSELEAAGGITPFQVWWDVINGNADLSDVPKKERWHLILKASELMAKYVYDASFNTEEAENAGMTLEQVEALKAAFPAFKKD